MVKEFEPDDVADAVMVMKDDKVGVLDCVADNVGVTVLDCESDCVWDCVGDWVLLVVDEWVGDVVLEPVTDAERVCVGEFVDVADFVRLLELEAVLEAEPDRVRETVAEVDGVTLDDGE